ncbi:MAG: hypothetical protein PVS3B3_25210 [Ktedonobacteraceae bacterium]
MNCQHPLAFLKNEAMFTLALDTTLQDLPEDMRSHVEQCELCRHDLMAYKQVNQALLLALYRKECPESITLSAYASNMLPRDKQIPLQLHLRVCPLCTAEVDEVRRFFADTEGVI